MKAKLIIGAILAGLAVLFIVQNTSVMDLRFLFWTLSMSGALLMILILSAGILLGWLLRGTFSRRRGIAHNEQNTAEHTTTN